MELRRLGDKGAEIPVARVGDTYLDLRQITADIDPEFFRRGGLERISEAIRGGTLPALEGAAQMRIGSPVSRPQAVLCIGLNYAAHAAESGLPEPEHPVLFFKHPNTLAGPNDDVPLPPGATQLDWEVELGLVVGRPAAYLSSLEEAEECIAGYVLANDISEREFQNRRGGGQWSKGKSMPGALPLGPALVTRDDLDTGAVPIRSWVNGEPRQDSDTGDMIFSPAQIVHDLSQYLTLEPGDVIVTGTPQGVALSGRFRYLRAGDVMEIEIEGLGRQRQRVVERTPGTAPHTATPSSPYDTGAPLVSRPRH